MARSGRSEGGADAERSAFKGCSVLPPLLPAAPSPSQSVSCVGSRWGSLLPSTCLSGPLRSFWQPIPSLSSWDLPVGTHFLKACLVGHVSASHFFALSRQGARVRRRGCCGSRSGLPTHPLAPSSPSLGLGLSQSFHPGIPAPFFFPTFFFKAQLILISSWKLP